METFFKGVGAFLFSIVHAILIDLFIMALMYCLGKLFLWIIPHYSLWLVIIVPPILLTVLWWAITFFSSITSIPYRKLATNGNPFKVFTLPIIVLVINAIGFCYREWTFSGNDAPKSYFITYNVIATILIVIITLVSIGCMLSDD